MEVIKVVARRKHNDLISHVVIEAPLQQAVLGGAEIGNKCRNEKGSSSSGVA